ncbi:MAG: DUF1624 domain-containing protein [Chitinophagaceae bacterium]
MPEPTLYTYQHRRIHSVDLLRGAIMLLMAIDHVRVYAGIPAGGPDPAIFFTRWVTHFCVSGFVFFAGTSAFLLGQKLNNRTALSKYLLTRGLLLVLLELTLIRFCWTFNLDFKSFMLAGVIWMLGWCMVLLAAAIWLPFRVIWISGLIIIAGQQIFGLVPADLHWWNFFYTVDYEGVQWINILYVLLPWIGVMMAGYGFGRLLQMPPALVRRTCWWIGFSAIALFVVIGSLQIVNDPKNEMPFIFRLLNQQKYPPSQLFLLMTLGPVILLIPYAEKARGWFAEVLSTFGKVPFFYYVLHILVIHLAALLVNLIRTGSIHQDWYQTAPYTHIAEDQQWPLPLLYIVFILVEIFLYWACHWYAAYKANHPEKKWLKYL